MNKKQKNITNILGISEPKKALFKKMLVIMNCLCWIGQDLKVLLHIPLMMVSLLI